MWESECFGKPAAECSRATDLLVCFSCCSHRVRKQSKCKQQRIYTQTWMSFLEEEFFKGVDRERESERRLIGERKKSLTYTPHLDMVLVSFAKKLLMWHDARELAFQRREKCLLALLVREKGLRYTPHISSLFGDFAVASTFYLPPICSPFFFFIFLFIPFVLLLLNTFLGHACTAWQATSRSICSRIFSGRRALAKVYWCFFIYSLTLQDCGCEWRAMMRSYCVLHEKGVSYAN